MSDLDEAFKESKLLPDAVLSGHAHLYERWHRVIGARDIPYLIAGSGGYGLGRISPKLKLPITWGELMIETEPIADYGYLLLTVDMTARPPELIIEFKRPAAPKEGDTLPPVPIAPLSKK